jgi:hypothetical protein
MMSHIVEKSISKSHIQPNVQTADVVNAVNVENSQSGKIHLAVDGRLLLYC